MKPNNFTQNTKRAMKHFSFFIFLFSFAFALSSCSKSDDIPTPSQNDNTTTFTLAVDGVTTRSTSTVTPARYIMEVWSEDGLTAENVFESGTKNRTEVTSGIITVALDKTKAYTCLFWADDNAAFDAASLKAIAVNADKSATEAYFSKVAVAKGKNPAVAVTLKRAVAKITLTETSAVKTDDNLVLKLTNIFPTFSVLDGTATGTAAEWTKTVKPSATTGVIGTFYLFAKAEKVLSDLTFTYAAEVEKTVSNIPVQQNHATNIKGEFSNLFAGTFTITADDAWTTPDNDVNFGKKAVVGDFYYSDNTFSNTLNTAKTCIGIVYVVNADGKTGKIVSLDEASNTKWSTETINTGATSNTNGAANTSTVFALGTYTAAKYPAFAWCATKNTSVPSGISWYIPAKEELKALYGKYNGDTKVDDGVKTAVNASLSNVSGAAQLSVRYWASTQGGDYTVCSVYFVDGYTTYNSNKYDDNSARAVSAF